METKARSEAVVAVPFEELWNYADSSLETGKQELQKAREDDSKSLRWVTRRVNITIERFDRYRQEIQLTIAIRFLSRIVIPFRVSMDSVDAETTHVLCSVEIILPRGLRGWLFRRLYGFGMKHLKIGTLQEWIDSAMRDWARLMDRTYQRFGNLAPASISETEKDIQKEQKTEQKQS
jgi:hypothetical protein